MYLCGSYVLSSGANWETFGIKQIFGVISGKKLTPGVPIYMVPELLCNWYWVNSINGYTKYIFVFAISYLIAKTKSFFYHNTNIWLIFANLTSNLTSVTFKNRSRYNHTLTYLLELGCIVGDWSHNVV